MANWKIVLASLGFSSACVALNATNPIVDLGYAKYLGAVDESLGVIHYYGLKYAAPPTGNLRWQPPVDIEDYFNTSTSPRLINATTQGPQCVQSNPPWEIELLAELGSLFSGAPEASPAEDEDCLLLDVVVPSIPTNASLPVIFQIHGGGYTTGNAGTYPGDNLVALSGGKVIYVSIQYRLGLYGFLSSSELAQNGTANAALLDQRSALYWVQRNIAKFGGDPAKVTIWGESAGGASVEDQLIMYGGVENPPFRAAICEYPGFQPYHDDQILEAQYNDLLNVTNCADISCLRALPADILANASTPVYTLGAEKGLYAYGDYYFGPTVDGVIIQDLPSEELKRGHFSPVPLLVDHDGYEGAFFTNFSISTTEDVLAEFQAFFPLAEPLFFTRLFQIYPLANYGASYQEQNPGLVAEAVFLPGLLNQTAWWQAQAIAGDFAINCPTYYAATALSYANMPVYKMRFGAGTELHGASASYLFGAVNATGNPELEETVRAYFLSFAMSLDPNLELTGVSRPTWPLYQGLNDTVILDIYDSYITTSADIDAWEGCDFFNSQNYVIRN